MHRLLCGMVLAGILLGSGAGRAETVVLRSGNGAIGGTDSLVHMLIGPAGSAFPNSFTAADFASAQSGPSAFIINPNGAWISSLPSDPSAQWIATNANGAGDGSTALYAISFTLTQPFGTAMLDLNYSVDNLLGTSPNEGVFLNGTPISGNSIGGGFGSAFSLTRSDIAPMLVVGTNTLYINATNQGGPAGLLFSATITTTISSVPEPGGIALMGIGSVSLILLAWRRRRPRGHQA